MNQIKNITIAGITLQGFKGFVQPITFKLENISLIEGDNGKGKSSILEAVIYAFTGCTLWGDNKNERLMNMNARKMQVDISFIDEAGIAHTLTRRRAGSNSSISFDGIPVRQAELAEAFGEKDTFLSIVNPLYFIECMADSSGRDFLLKLLPTVSHEDVLLSLDEYNRELLNGESLLNPATYIKNLRTEIRELEDNKTYTQGQIDTLSKKVSAAFPAAVELDEKITTCHRQLENLEDGKPGTISTLSLESRKLIIKAELDSLQKEQPILEDISQPEIRLVELKGSLALLKSEKYTSGVADLLGGIDNKLQQLRQEWNRLYGVVRSIKPGSCCPSCMQLITEEHLSSVKVAIQKEKDTLKDTAAPIKKRREWLSAQDEESRLNFEARLLEDIHSCEQDIAKLTEDLDKIKDSNTKIIKEFADKKQQMANKLQSQLTELDQQISELKNISAEAMRNYENSICFKKQALLKELDDLLAMKHDMKESLEASGEISRLSEILKSSDETILRYERKIHAAAEYAAKRAELSLKPLKMNLVEIKLQEIVKTTGEVVNTFRFTYEGRDYRLLSLSEKLRAGLEVSGLIVHLTGRSYPVLVDNSESITVIDNLDIQRQAVFARVTAGSVLAVKNLTTSASTELASLPMAV